MGDAPLLEKTCGADQEHGRLVCELQNNLVRGDLHVAQHTDQALWLLLLCPAAEMPPPICRLRVVRELSA